MNKGSSSANVWSDYTRVYLREPKQGASSVLWVDLYEGPEMTPENIDSPEVKRADAAARMAAGRLAAKWAELTYSAARAEYDAL